MLGLEMVPTKAPPWYIGASGCLDVDKLHRVVNGRGRVEREYALGSRRLDLLIVWQVGDGGVERFVVECKLVKDGWSARRAIKRGLEQRIWKGTRITVWGV